MEGWLGKGCECAHQQTSAKEAEGVATLDPSQLQLSKRATIQESLLICTCMSG